MGQVAVIEEDRLPKGQRKALRWGSHEPVLLAAIDIFRPDGALELGAGSYSTRLLFERIQSVTSIEADQAWIERLRADGLAETGKQRLVYHPLPGFRRAVKPHEVPKNTLNEATKFYLRHSPSNMDLLFVDCYAGFRRRALEDLHKFFDVCIYHDAEPKADQHYGFSSMKIDPGYVRMIDKTFPAHTGIIIAPSRHFLLPAFKAKHHECAMAFAERFGVACRVELECLRC